MSQDNHFESNQISASKKEQWEKSLAYWDGLMLDYWENRIITIDSNKLRQALFNLKETIETTRKLLGSSCSEIKSKAQNFLDDFCHFLNLFTKDQKYNYAAIPINIEDFLTKLRLLSSTNIDENHQATKEKKNFITTLCQCISHLFNKEERLKNQLQDIKNEYAQSQTKCPVITKLNHDADTIMASSEKGFYQSEASITSLMKEFDCYKQIMNLKAFIENGITLAESKKEDLDGRKYFTNEVAKESIEKLLGDNNPQNQNLSTLYGLRNEVAKIEKSFNQASAAALKKDVETLYTMTNSFVETTIHTQEENYAKDRFKLTDDPFDELVKEIKLTWENFCDGIKGIKDLFSESKSIKSTKSVMHEIVENFQFFTKAPSDKPIQKAANAEQHTKLMAMVTIKSLM